MDTWIKLIIDALTIVDSIKPVITKCKPSSNDIDIDLIKVEIENIIGQEFKNFCDE